MWLIAWSQCIAVVVVVVGVVTFQGTRSFGEGVEAWKAAGLKNVIPRYVFSYLQGFKAYQQALLVVDWCKVLSMLCM